MNKERYKNREIDEKHNQLVSEIRGVKDDVCSVQKEMEEGFSEMKERQDITNGRVSWLEKMMYLGMGGLAVLSLKELTTLLF